MEQCYSDCWCFLGVGPALKMQILDDGSMSCGWGSMMDPSSSFCT